MSTPLKHLYDSALADGQLLPDSAQEYAITVLEDMINHLQSDTLHPEGKHGVYLYGPVGRGKSEVMRLLLESQPVDLQKRVHFHAFMEDVHARMHALPPTLAEDPMMKIAKDLAAEAQLFCFDEFYITNIADAMLLGRLMQMLFRLNIAVVATSNWAPDDLFQGGVNRHQFMPFIALIKRHLQVVEVTGETDYRQQHKADLPLYHIGLKANTWLKAHLETYGKGQLHALLPQELKLTHHKGTAVWAKFDDLCDQAIGRETYLQLAQAVDTLLIEDIPTFLPNQADAALRLITCIDIFYEAKKRLIITAQTNAENLCATGPAAAAFVRAASRLAEMQSWI